MQKSIEITILEKVKRKDKGTLFFTNSILKNTNPDAVRKALERLVKSGELHRVATGIYVRPVIDDYIGKVLPGIEEIAKAIAKRDRATIIPTGNYAMYKLGLTTQVPLNVVYYTDTSARKIKIGKQTITFKKASSKNLAFVGQTSMLAIQALRTIGKEQATGKEIKQIKTIIKKENSKHLQHDLELAPVWIRTLLKTK
jgi:predicted transcriptional regulator of viral defense system